MAPPRPRAEPVVNTEIDRPTSGAGVRATISDTPAGWTSAWNSPSASRHSTSCSQVRARPKPALARVQRTTLAASSFRRGRRSTT
jgi:hypothetical protein